ncbi:polycystic kidney disease 2-like 2 protein [Drosophila obscura]|uniref:polycystic kidney disease 2-like 2 protein n=1 Tax=Drosophila obscura TaxID=7282 RepID=UPI001BB2922F|nr:polycystic kidney disease 2-like 2 protein [Drosophila obscura]
MTSGVFHSGSNAIFFGVTAFVMLASFVMIAIFTGFQHETKKFKTMVVTVVLVLLFQFIVLDPIKFIVLSIDSATWPRKHAMNYKPEKAREKYNHLDYLRTRLRSLKSQLMITIQHRNEKLNEKYSHIMKDLKLYGSYFLLLLMVVIVHQDPLLYHNTNAVMSLLSYNTSNTLGLKEIRFMDQVYDFIELTLIKGFNPHQSMDTGWLQIRQMKRLGVIRLRQLRHIDNIGVYDPQWDYGTGMPEWNKPFRRLHYEDKYWRIYEPWRPIRHTPSLEDGLLLNFNHYGYDMDYPELLGYVALLTTGPHNSLKVLGFLKRYNWLDRRNTSAVFMDFTMFNADANIFTVCTLLVENTNFGLQLTHATVESTKLLESLDQMSHLKIIVMLLYLILVIQFCRSLLVKLWYNSSAIKKAWNKVDVVICILNFMLVALMILREWEVSKILKLLKESTTRDYLNFQRPTRLYLLINVVLGMIVCITTLRLWKVLQFASVFSVFTKTLYLAWPAVASTALIIIIFLMGLGTAVAIINGNNSEYFQRLVKCIIACLCFAFGFSSEVHPRDMFHGGKALGIVLYLVLVFIIAVVLMNVFAALIFSYFESAEQDRKENKSMSRINFLQFLRLEFANTLAICGSCFFRKSYRSGGRTVRENVAWAMYRQELIRSKQSSFAVVQKPSDEELRFRYRQRIEMLLGLSAILTVQVELVERLLLGDKDGNLPVSSGSDDSDIPDMYRKKENLR